MEPFDPNESLLEGILSKEDSESSFGFRTGRLLMSMKSSTTLRLPWPVTFL